MTNFYNEPINYLTPGINKYIQIVSNLTSYLESLAMNYPRSQFFKNLHTLKLSFGRYSICATCDISGTSGSATCRYTKIIRNLVCRLLIDI